MSMSDNQKTPSLIVDAENAIAEDQLSIIIVFWMIYMLHVSACTVSIQQNSKIANTNTITLQR